MKERIVQAIRSFFKWVKHWLWEHPISKPTPEAPIKVKASEVSKEYVVIEYHGQRINLHIATELPIWNVSSRKDKRITKDKFAKYEREGTVKFMEIEGHMVCVRNLDFQRRADKIKEAK